MGLEIGTVIALAGLAASAGGAAYSVKSSADAQGEMTKRVNEQVRAQNEQSKKNKTVLDKNVEQSTPDAMKQQIGQGASQAQDLYSKVGALPQTSATGSQAATLGAQNTASVDQGAQQSYARMMQAPAAQMQGLQTALGQQRIGNQLTASQLGIGNFLSGLNASTLPYLLNAAQAKAGTGQAIGSLLGSMGGLASTYGAQAGGLKGLYGGDYSATNGVANKAAIGLGSSDPFTSGRF